MDYKVADITLSDFGNKEIGMANKEMPGLIALQEKYSGKKPLSGVKITRSGTYRTLKFRGVAAMDEWAMAPNEHTYSNCLSGFGLEDNNARRSRRSMMCLSVKQHRV